MAEPNPPDDLTADRAADDLDQPEHPRYATIALARGETVLYDRRNPQAWLQSDAAVAPATME
jgi:hypothetical protein